MTKFKVNYSKTGVPILSADDIEELSIHIIKNYKPELLIQPQEFDVDDFAEFFLNCNLEIQYLSNNGCYLGMCFFNKGKIIVYDKENNSIKGLNVSEKTIILDSSLYEDESKETLRRFTLAHECGHILFHRQYFKNSELPAGYLNDNKQDIVGKRRDLLSDRDWLEWQANTISACLLMNKFAVIKYIRSMGYSFDKLESYHAILLAPQISKIFNVSKDAAQVRLKKILTDLKKAS